MWLAEGDRDRHESVWRRLDGDYRGDGPCGVLTLLDDPDPEAEWSDPRTLYAGYAEDGRQLRIAYFSAAVTRPRAVRAAGETGARVVPFAGSGVSRDAVIALWLREGVLAQEEAHRRVDEVQVVAVDRDGAPVGVCTRFLHRNAQLGMDLWHIRVFVTAAHRETAVAGTLAVGARDSLQDDFVTGRDTRGSGMAIEVQSAVLRTLEAPVWRETQVALIADVAGGFPVRVFYFPGARAPLPQGST